jgi:hypothetical protein
MKHHDPVPMNVKHAHVLTSMFLGLVHATAGYRGAWGWLASMTPSDRAGSRSVSR